MKSASRKICDGRRSAEGKGQMPEASETGSPGFPGWTEVLDAVPEAISVHTPDGRIVKANRHLAALYGVQEADIVGLECQQFFHGEGDPCSHDEALQRKATVTFESRLPDGTVYGVTVSPTINNEGAVTGYVRMMRDQTQRQESLDQLIRTERFATLGQMISGIAHDVGTPLNIISGYSEYLLMRTREGAPGHKEISTILQQTRRISEFIKQMLDLARPGNGRADAIGLKSFLAESIDLIGHHFRKANVKASLICEIEPPVIYGDAPRLRQAFVNLFLNACHKAGADGKLEVRLEEADDAPGFIKIWLLARDSNGEGHNFSETFADLKTPGRYNHVVGMGLSLAREIFDNVGARITSIDQGEEGVALVVYLPKSKGGITTDRS